jgi:hypothetical protein
VIAGVTGAEAATVEWSLKKGAQNSDSEPSVN